MLSSVVSSSLLFLLNESRFEPRLWLATEGLVDLKDIKAIIDLMKKNSISEFELERQDFKIRLKRGSNAGAIPVQYDELPTLAAPFPAAALSTGALATTVQAASGSVPELEIKSPMIGTFYRAPSP